MRISDWSSDVCSSDLGQAHFQGLRLDVGLGQEDAEITKRLAFSRQARAKLLDRRFGVDVIEATQILRELREDLRHFRRLLGIDRGVEEDAEGRSEEHTSELQSLMRISYAVFCLQKQE